MFPSTTINAVGLRYRCWIRWCCEISTSTGVVFVASTLAVKIRAALSFLGRRTSARQSDGARFNKISRTASELKSTSNGSRRRPTSAVLSERPCHGNLFEIIRHGGVAGALAHDGSRSIDKEEGEADREADESKHDVSEFSK